MSVAEDSIDQEKPTSGQFPTSRARNFATILSGVSLVFVGAVTSRGLEFAARTVAARYMGPEGFGILGTSISILSIAGAVVLFGLPAGLVRFAGQFQDEERDSLSGFVYAAFWFVVVSGGGLGFVIWLFDDWIAQRVLQNPQLTIVIRLVGVSLPFFVALAIISATFQAVKDARAYVIINNFLLPITRLAGISVAVILGWELVGVLSIFLWGSLGVSLIMALVLLKKHSLQLFSIQQNFTKELKPLLRFSSPLLLSSLLGYTLWQVDVILLQRIWGTVEAGFYTAALTIGRLPNMVLLAFSFMIIPYLAQQYARGHLQDMQKLYGQAVDLIFMIGLPLVAAFVVFAPLILKVLLGQQYLGAVNLFRVLAIGYFLHSIVGPNGKTLIMIGRSWMFLIGSAISVTFTVFLYIILIPVYGGMGAAISTLTGLAVMNAIFLVSLFRQTGINPLPWFRLRLIGAMVTAALLGIVAQNALETILSDWLLLGFVLCIHFAAYTGISLLFRIVKPDELLAFRNLFRKQHLEAN